MVDHATPNLPSRGFDATAAFYATLGFEVRFRDEGWMILERGGLTVEFFPHLDLDPLTSASSCCLRLDDLDAFYGVALASGLPETTRGQPRLHPPRHEPGGVRVGYLIDPDGNLLRLVGN